MLSVTSSSTKTTTVFQESCLFHNISLFFFISRGVAVRRKSFAACVGTCLYFFSDTPISVEPVGMASSSLGWELEQMASAQLWNQADQLSWRA